ncbi:AAA family ATPase [Lichenihabitans sp. Uapishka_5]|uniref:AAA family ATPase n=1 Tax=Lichenihabitans sp. Uapishka_5 TaxID=3037302 RepID=UPI0029E8246E|nr:AAA family ATPase [Lichenihabitans sp. Uapishka_5]MDX7951727.1 AAA family ATPase [Lichenihabitans sp. Uapishka_5]
MQCFILGPGRDSEYYEALIATTRELDLPCIDVRDFADLVADKRFGEAAHPLVLVPDTPGHRQAIDPVIAFAREQNGHAFVAYLSDEVASGDYKRLVRTSFAEWITWRDCRDEMRELVARLTSATVAGRTAKVVSFLPVKGGVGNTTLLIEVGAYLSSRRKRGGMRVAILDLNLQGGSVADALDVEPRFDVAEIVGRPERLDEQLIDIFTSRRGATLDIFASPPNRIGLDAVSPEIVFTFLDAVSDRYDVILLDLPSQSMSWSDTLLQGSDAIVLSTGESVPALRKIAAFLLHLDGLAVPDKKLAVAVNAVEADLLGRVARRDVIERPLAKRTTFTVRRDDKATMSALDLGRPLFEMAAGSKAAKDMKRIAEWVEAVTDLAQVAARSGPPASTKRKAVA